MRISDWSSDVCSSDLLGKNVIQVKVAVIVDAEAAVRIAIGQCIVKECRVERGGIAFLVLVLGRKHLAEIQGKDKQAGVAALLLTARVGAGCIAGRFHGPAQFLLAEIGNRSSSRFLAHKLIHIAPERSEERGLGKECASTFRSRRSPYL